jgi:hypothetical protein
MSLGLPRTWEDFRAVAVGDDFCVLVTAIHARCLVAEKKVHTRQFVARTLHLGARHLDIALITIEDMQFHANLGKAL